MTQRLEWKTVAPDSYAAMLNLEKYATAGVDPILLELVKMRASHLNGCAYCIDMHSHDALKNGESLQRLFLVAAWREAEDFFTARERAALALTDAITRIGEHGVSDEIWQGAAAHFEEKELVDLTTAIVTINAWNRFAISLRLSIPRRT
jgi:AhpD family alkylhydroperoxidase